MSEEAEDPTIIKFQRPQTVRHLEEFAEELRNFLNGDGEITDYSVNANYDVNSCYSLAEDGPEHRTWTNRFQLSVHGPTETAGSRTAIFEASTESLPGQKREQSDQSIFYGLRVFITPGYQPSECPGDMEIAEKVRQFNGEWD